MIVSIYLVDRSNRDSYDESCTVYKERLRIDTRQKSQRLRADVVSLFRMSRFTLYKIRSLSNKMKKSR